MGCTQSKQNSYERQSGTRHESFPTSKSNPLTEKEIQMRIESPNSTQVLELGGVKYRYAWMSQRGYYPESPDKDNQDAYSIHPSFGEEKDQSFFAIYDGHGKDGHHCARFARDNLHKSILEKFSKIPAGGFNHKSIKQALSVAHNATNDAMHACKNFDDSLSGTTAISILFRGRMMYVSNVGDSRAIVISKSDDGRLVAKPLSSDQTPYRKDERERIKKYGARILSMDQIEGIEPVHENWGDLNLGEDIDEGGDPPRVWSANGNYPGTAFTRSLGDVFAEECGVVSDPEILEREINANDKFVVIASDGVFEFLTNQMVADMLARYADPLEACKAVVGASYNMWLQYEVRTDDISIIAFYIDDVSKATGFDHSSSFYSPAMETSVGAALTINPGASSTAVSSLAAPSPSANSMKSVANAASPTAASNNVSELESRPVRRVMSREKKKHMISLHHDDDEDNEQQLTDAEMQALITTKRTEEEQVIMTAMKTNFLFQHLNAAQRSAVVGVMKSVNVKKGEWVIRQGDAGDKFYVVDTGRFEVRVKMTPDDGSHPAVHSTMSDDEKEQVGGSVVHIYESGPEQHPGFGELSLMYGKPRAASVIALTEGKLWALDRRVFRRVVLRPKDIRRDIIRILKKVELLKCLSLTQLQRLTDLLNEADYQLGQYIIRQGEVGETFYIIVSGNCDCSIGDPNGEQPPKVVMQLKDYDYFGERALLERKPRAANVVVTSPTTKVLYIDKSAFEEVLGPLADIIEDDRIRREQAAAKQLAAASSPSSSSSLAEFNLLAKIATDNMGLLLLGSFAKKDKKPAVTIRSFLLSEIHKQSMSESAVRYLEAAKLLSTAKATNGASLLAAGDIMQVIRQSSALHVVYDTAVISDLSTFIRGHTEALVDDSAQQHNVTVFTLASLVLALEALHKCNIVYRAIQPESIHIDAMGNILLLDYRYCKLGLFYEDVASSKTFTICGASDYLSPEQISQTGHNYAVDLWALGILLYELSVGSHPFSSSTEVATYSKITSFGTKAFPALKFPDAFPADTKALINQLLMPTPEARIGVGSSGMQALKKHPFFESTSLWETLPQRRDMSPLRSVAEQALTELLSSTDSVITDEGSLMNSFANTLDPTIGNQLTWLDGLDL